MYYLKYARFMKDIKSPTFRGSTRSAINASDTGITALYCDDGKVFWATGSRLFFCSESNLAECEIDLDQTFEEQAADGLDQETVAPS